MAKQREVQKESLHSLQEITILYCSIHVQAIGYSILKKGKNSYLSVKRENKDIVKMNADGSRLHREVIIQILQLGNLKLKGEYTEHVPEAFGFVMT